MSQPNPTKGKLELLATYDNNDEGKAQCWRAKQDGIANGCRMFVDIAPTYPNKGMLRLWRDREGIKRGQDTFRNGKRTSNPKAKAP